MSVKRVLSRFGASAAYFFLEAGQQVDRRAARVIRIDDAQARPHGDGNIQWEGLRETANAGAIAF
jgi:hypothetical protein